MDAWRLRLYLVADPDLVDGELTSVVSSAIAGGVTCVQLRVKSGSDRAFERLGIEIADLCRERATMFLVNDRLDIAMASGADGVHLGVDDLSIEAARRAGGRGMVIGYSPETDEQAAVAAYRGADYLGVGPIYGTASKADAGDPIGVQTLGRQARLSGLPTIGIGGITAANAADALTTGARGVAVMSAILGSSDPESAARALASAMDARST